VTTVYMTTTEAWYGDKNPAWAKCEPGTHPYTEEVFPARQHTQTDGTGAKQMADVLARHTGTFAIDLDLYKDGAPEKWEACPLRAWIGDRQPYMVRGTQGSIKFLIKVPDEISATWWPFASGLGWGEIRSAGIVPSPGSLHGRSGQLYEAVPGTDTIIYPDGQIIQGNVIVLDQAGIEAFEAAGARNKLAEALESGREDLPGDDGRCSLVYAWFQDPEHFNSKSPRGDHANKAVNYLKQMDAEGHRVGGWIDDVVARLPHTSMENFEGMWKTAPVKAGTVSAPRSCCQEILMNFTPPQEAGALAIEYAAANGHQQAPPPVTGQVNPLTGTADWTVWPEDVPAGRIESGQPPAPPQQPVTLADRLWAGMLTWVEIRDTPMPRAVISGWLYEDTLAWIKGPPGGGKSLTAVDMAGCVVTGRPWHGHPVQQGNVLYLVLEGKASIAQRVAAWMTHNGVVPQGKTFSPMAVNLLDNAYAQAIADIAYWLKPKLIVVDTQARATPGAEENSSKDMGILVANLDYIRSACQACILVVHHEGRAGQHLRGSTALPGAASTIIDAEKTGMTVTLTTQESKGGRQKDAPENKPFALTMVPAGPGLALTIPTGLEAFTGIGEHERAVLDLLKLAKTWVSKTDISEQTKIPKGTLGPKLWALRDSGRIEEKEHGQAKLYRYSLPDGGGSSGSGPDEPDET
jgi:hypothetical protein